MEQGVLVATEWQELPLASEAARHTLEASDATDLFQCSIPHDVKHIKAPTLALIQSRQSGEAAAASVSPL